jgi:hypothetical protein
MGPAFLMMQLSVRRLICSLNPLSSTGTQYRRHKGIDVVGEEDELVFCRTLRRALLVSHNANTVAGVPLVNKYDGAE